MIVVFTFEQQQQLQVRFTAKRITGTGEMIKCQLREWDTL